MLYIPGSFKMQVNPVLLSLNVILVLILYYMVFVRVLGNIDGRVKCYTE